MCDGPVLSTAPVGVGARSRLDDRDEPSAQVPHNLKHLDVYALYVYPTSDALTFPTQQTPARLCLPQGIWKSSGAISGRNHSPTPTVAL